MNEPNWVRSWDWIASTPQIFNPGEVGSAQDPLSREKVTACARSVFQELDTDWPVSIELAAKLIYQFSEYTPRFVEIFSHLNNDDKELIINFITHLSQNSSSFWDEQFDSEFSGDTTALLTDHIANENWNPPSRARSQNMKNQLFSLLFYHALGKCNTLVLEALLNNIDDLVPIETLTSLDQYLRQKINIMPCKAVAFTARHALHLICTYGSLPLINRMMDLGVDLNKRRDLVFLPIQVRGETALHVLLGLHYLPENRDELFALVKKMVVNGAHLHLRTHSSSLPNFFLFTEDQQLELLHASRTGSDQAFYSDWLCRAVSNGHYRLAAELHELGGIFENVEALNTYAKAFILGALLLSPTDNGELIAQCPLLLTLPVNTLQDMISKAVQRMVIYTEREPEGIIPPIVLDKLVKFCTPLFNPESANILHKIICALLRNKNSAPCYAFVKSILSAAISFPDVLACFRGNDVILETLLGHPYFEAEFAQSLIEKGFCLSDALLITQLIARLNAQKVEAIERPLSEAERIEDALVTYLLEIYCHRHTIMGVGWFADPLLLKAFCSMRPHWIRAISKVTEDPPLWLYFWKILDMHPEANVPADARMLPLAIQRDLISGLCYLIMVTRPIKLCSLGTVFDIQPQFGGIVPIGELAERYPELFGFVLLMPERSSVLYPLHHLCRQLSMVKWQSNADLFWKFIWGAAGGNSSALSQLDDQGRSLLHCLADDTAYRKVFFGKMGEKECIEVEAQLRLNILCRLLAVGLDPNLESQKGEVLLAMPHWTEEMRMKLFNASKIPVDVHARPACLKGASYLEFALARGEMRFASLLIERGAHCAALSGAQVFEVIKNGYPIPHGIRTMMKQVDKVQLQIALKLLFDQLDRANTWNKQNVTAFLNCWIETDSQPFGVPLLETLLDEACRRPEVVHLVLQMMQDAPLLIMKDYKPGLSVVDYLCLAEPYLEELLGPLMATPAPLNLNRAVRKNYIERHINPGEVSPLCLFLLRNGRRSLGEHLVRQWTALAIERKAWAFLAALFHRVNMYDWNGSLVEEILQQGPETGAAFLHALDKENFIAVITKLTADEQMLVESPFYRPLILSVCESRKISLDLPPLAIDRDASFVLADGWLDLYKGTYFYPQLTLEEYDRRAHNLRTNVLELWDAVKWSSAGNLSKDDPHVVEDSVVLFHLNSLRTKEDVRRALDVITGKIIDKLAWSGTASASNNEKRFREYTIVLMDFEAIVEKMLSGKMTKQEVAAGLADIAYVELDRRCFAAYRTDIRQKRDYQDGKAPTLDGAIDHAIVHALQAEVEELVQARHSDSESLFAHYILHARYAVGLEMMADNASTRSKKSWREALKQRWTIEGFARRVHEPLEVDQIVDWLKENTPVEYGLPYHKLRNKLAKEEWRLIELLGQQLAEIVQDPALCRKIGRTIKTMRGKLFQNKEEWERLLGMQDVSVETLTRLEQIKANFDAGVQALDALPECDLLNVGYLPQTDLSPAHACTNARRLSYIQDILINPADKLKALLLLKGVISVQPIPRTEPRPRRRARARALVPGAF